MSTLNAGINTPATHASFVRPADAPEGMMFLLLSAPHVDSAPLIFSHTLKSDERAQGALSMLLSVSPGISAQTIQRIAETSKEVGTIHLHMVDSLIVVKEAFALAAPWQVAACTSTNTVTGEVEEIVNSL